jgi:hypothetical protein
MNFIPVLSPFIIRLTKSEAKKNVPCSENKDLNPRNTNSNTSKEDINFVCTQQKNLYNSHTIQANNYLKKLQSCKLKADIHVLPLVTSQFTALGNSRKKMPSDKCLS